MRTSLRTVWLPFQRQWTVEHMNETEKKHKLAIIVGSVREGRFGPVVASWVAEQARVPGRRPRRRSYAHKHPLRQSISTPL